MNVDDHTIEHESGRGVVRFPQLSAWLTADPAADAETFRGSTVADLEGAAAYARALIGVASNLDPGPEFDQGDEVVLPSADLDGLTLTLVGSPAATRRALTNVVALATQMLSAAEDPERGERDAADDFVPRQTRNRRVLAFEARIDALAQGDSGRASDIRRGLPNPWTDLDSAEVEIDRFASEVHARLVEQTAAASVIPLSHRRRAPEPTDERSTATVHAEVQP